MENEKVLEVLDEKLKGYKDEFVKQAAESEKKHEAVVNELNEELKKKGASLAEIKTAVDSINEELKEVKMKQGRIHLPNGNDPKNFGSQFAENIAKAFTEQKAAFDEFQRSKSAKIGFEIKAVGNMTVSNNLTGEGQASYNTRQGLVPANKINFRDLVPTTPSPSGIYVSYRETGSEGAIAVQTEGSAKSQIDYDLSRVSVVSDYIAGFARFSKQMMYQLPWLQNTLPRLLMRDFYKKENSTFYGIVAAGATGSTTTDKTVDIEQVVAYIANQLNADFTPSFGLVNFTDWQNLLLTKPADYSVPGGVQIDANGNIRICGVPIIGASWATVDKFTLIDSDFVERVETESVRVELSYEDSDNFQKNLVTARVECFEDLNLLRTDAHIYADFGNLP